MPLGPLTPLGAPTLGVVRACSTSAWRMEIQKWRGFGRANEKPRWMKKACPLL